MVFKWRINRPAFQAAANGVDVMHPGIETEFETGSISEAHGIFTDSGTALAQMFGSTLMGGVNGLAVSLGGGEPQTGEQEAGEQTGTGRGRGRPRKDKNQPDPSAATAPAPVTIPGTEAPPVAPLAPAADGGIPPFLDRTKDAAAAPPPPPPAPPPAPPTGILAGKIAAELEGRAAGSADGGQALADWLATSGITIKGATFPEAIKVLRLAGDEKLGPIATALKVA